LRFNTAIEIQASGVDEDFAIRVVENRFVDTACDDEQGAEGTRLAERTAASEPD